MPLEKQKQEIRLLISKNSSFDLCITNIEEYKQSAINLNNKTHTAYADYYTAHIYMGKGSYLRAKQLIQGIIPYFIQTKNYEFLQASYLVMGVIKNDLNNPEESLVYYSKATQIKTSIKQNQTVAYNNLTNILGNTTRQ